MVTQAVKQDGQGSIVGHEDSKFRTPGNMEVSMAEEAWEVLRIESPLGCIVQDDSVLIPQERTKERLGIQEQTKCREHEEQEEQNGYTRNENRGIGRVLSSCRRRDFFPLFFVSPMQRKSERPAVARPINEISINFSLLQASGLASPP